MNKPNIVIILNDHQAFYNHNPKRPVFDRFASEGVRFDEAYTCSPLCGPARRSLLTGLYPHRHGELRNNFNHPYDKTVYLNLLRENGYELFYYGKWHAGSGNAGDFGCEGFSHGGFGNPYTKPEYTRYLAEMGLEPPEVFVEDEYSFHEKSSAAGIMMCQNRDACTEHASGIMLAPKEAHEAYFLANMAKKQIKQLADRSEDMPFHLRIDFWGPHHPYFPTQDFAAMYDPSSMNLPISFNENVYRNNKPKCYTRDFNSTLTDDRKNLLFPNPVNESVWCRTMARCYAQITLVDAAAGVILDALKEYGFYDNTIVVMTTDHGDCLACHGGHFDKAYYMPQELLKIPMAIRYPGYFKPGTVVNNYVSNMDVPVTLLEAAGLSFPEKTDGIPLISLCAGTLPKRRYMVCETHGHKESYLGRALIMGDYKYIYNHDDIDELYHLKNDPFELRNLVDNESFLPVLREYKTLLSEWVDTSGDVVSELKAAPIQSP